jgi:hypothetical protein
MRFTPQTFGVEQSQRCDLQLRTPTYNRLGAGYQHRADRNHGDPHHQPWR